MFQLIFWFALIVALNLREVVSTFCNFSSLDAAAPTVPSAERGLETSNPNLLHLKPAKTSTALLVEEYIYIKKLFIFISKGSSKWRKLNWNIRPYNRDQLYEFNRNKGLLGAVSLSCKSDAFAYCPKVPEGWGVNTNADIYLSFLHLLLIWLYDKWSSIFLRMCDIYFSFWYSYSTSSVLTHTIRSSYMYSDIPYECGIGVLPYHPEHYLPI